MASAGTFIAAPLGWLQSEIDRSLAIARAALAEAFAAPAKASAALARCETCVRQIRGALAIIRLEGAARFCAALEQALHACSARPARLNQASVGVMDRAMFALSQFLADIVNGEADVPLKLFPLYRELAELGGRSEAGESELFFPDLDLVPEAQRQPLAAGESDRMLAACRAQFQRGLLAWLRKPDDVQALHAMRTALDALDGAADPRTLPPGLWWCAGALIDLLGQTQAAAERESGKGLLARLERAMRDSFAGGTSDAVELMREILYRIALTTGSSPRITEAKALYRLDAQLPEFCVSGTLEYDESALAPVLNDMRRRLAAIEEAWSRYAAGSSGELARLRNEASGLKAIARDLGHYRLVRLLDIVALIAAKLPDAYPVSNQLLALEMAAALLFMEGMLDHFTRPPADIDQQVAVMVGWLLDAMKPRGVPSLGTGAPRDDITQRQQYAEIRAQVAREILVNLRAIETTVEEIVRNPERSTAITTLDARVRQMAGALKMLGLNRANGVLSACLHLMKLSASQDTALTRASLEWVADGLSCLGFYLQNIQQGENPAEDILLGFVQRLSRDERPAGSTDWIGPTGEAASETGTAQQARSEPVDPEDRARPLRESQDASDSDPDLRGVYVGEAQELLPVLREAFAHAHGNATDMDALVQLRRGFHTLKGGARLVGLDALGGLAADVEDALDVFASGERRASVELFVLLDEALDVFGHAVSALAQRLEPDASDYARLSELAAAVREPEEMLEPALDALDAQLLAPLEAKQAPRAAGAFEPHWDTALETGEPGEVLSAASTWAAPESQEQPSTAIAMAVKEVTIGSVRLSRSLFETYAQESTELLATVERELRSLRATPTLPFSEALLRAAHTLCSTASHLEFEAVAELAAAFEAALHRLAWWDGLSPPELEVLEAAALSLSRMAGEIRACDLPQRDQWAEEQLGSLAAPVRDASELTAHPDAERDRGTADPRLLGLFLEEAAELVPRLQSALTDWRHEPHAVEPSRALTRLLHTLKGSARVAGALRLGERIHLLESRVARASVGVGDPLEELQAEVDAIEVHIDRLGGEHDRRPPSPVEAAPALAAEARATPAPARATSGRILVDRELLERLSEHASEMSLSGARVERDVFALRQSLDDLTDSIGRLRGQLRETQMQADTQLPAALEPGRSEAGFDPLEMDRYTRMQELTRMMAESVHDMQMIQSTLAASAADVEAAAALQSRLGRGMQQDLSALSSTSFGTLRGRLQRTVRQCARELERQVDLRLEGADMALDRSLLQQLTAPLEHLLRNAVAHGIEPAAVRATRGKPAAGEIVVAAKREGIDAVLTVRDDGAGIDVARLREEAVRRGLSAADEDIADWKLKALIFTPGLSTAAQVTATSGRGIGLDAVRSQIEALGGSIDLTSTPGTGTAFDIRLPLYSAASQVLLVQVEEAVYAIPSALVAGIEELPASDLDRAHAEGALMHAALSFPFLSLARLLGHSRSSEGKRQIPVVLLESDGQRLALQVDAVVRSQEVLLKPLGPQLARVRGLAGAALLGRDEVALVLNPLAWPGTSRQKHADVAPHGTAAEPTPDRVLVVDDSLTVRRLTGRLLARSGYRVREAKDGADALEQIREDVPDLIVLDLEMPRMDGFELMRQLRANAGTASIPIVVVSSRLADKHRRRAFDGGAAAFFGKPYPEDALLACIEQLLRLGSTARAA